MGKIIDILTDKKYIVLYQITFNVAKYVPKQLAEQLLKGIKGVKNALNEKGVTIINTKVKAIKPKKGDKKKKQSESDDENNDGEEFFI